MSTIHEALVKAQKQRDAIPDTYVNVGRAGDSGKRPRPAKGILAAAAVLLAVLAVGGWLLATRPGGENRTMRTANASKPDNAARSPAAVPATEAEPETGVRNPPSGDKTHPKPGQGPAQVVEKQPPDVAEVMERGREFAKRIKETHSPPVERDPDVPEIRTRVTAPETTPARTVEHWYDTAVSLHVKGDLEGARRHYETTLRFAPDHARSINNLAVMDMEQGHLDKAATGFLHAASVDENYVDPYFNLACLHARKDEPNQAVNYLKKAIAINDEARQWAIMDKDLSSLYHLPEFKETVASFND
ncbi:MAG: TPR end-of-group domain-containing protein [Desulfatibacillaceae bacterium]